VTTGWAPTWWRGRNTRADAHLSSNGGQTTVCGADIDGQPIDRHPATGDSDGRCQACNDILGRARAAVLRRGKA
jgi:hypothetical protein